jgi:hypothetical protein
MANKWFLLVDGDGLPFGGTTPSKLKISSDGDVDDFIRHNVKMREIF